MKVRLNDKHESVHFTIKVFRCGTPQMKRHPPDPSGVTLIIHYTRDLSDFPEPSRRSGITQRRRNSSSATHQELHFLCFQILFEWGIRPSSIHKASLLLKLHHKSLCWLLHGMMDRFSQSTSPRIGFNKTLCGCSGHSEKNLKKPTFISNW